jgi:hypothetical protein
MGKEDRKKTSLMLDPGIVEKIPRSMSISDAVEAALSLWFEARNSPSVEQVVVESIAKLGYRDANRGWHNKLERVLNEGTERDKVGIQANLDWAIGALKPLGEVKKRRAG